MQRIGDDACSRTGKSCPQGPDLALSKPTRDAFQMIHCSFRKIRSQLHERGLRHIAEDLSFVSFTTLDTEHFFSGMRTSSLPTRTCMTTLQTAMLHHRVRRKDLSVFFRLLYRSSESLRTTKSTHPRARLVVSKVTRAKERPTSKGYSNTPGQGQATLGG